MVILVQGAMEEEIDFFLKSLEVEKKETISGYDFYVANKGEHKIVISLTGCGTFNATISLMLAIEHFSPDLVINQGCAGSHSLKLGVGDIVIGSESVYINDFKTPEKNKGEGSNSLEWIPHEKRSYRVSSTEKYVEIARNIEYDGGKVVVGVLGTGDLFSREYDRIIYLASQFGESCEDMETLATFKVCETLGIDRVGYRIISNNELTKEKFDITVCEKMQRFVLKIIDKILQ